MRSSTSNRQARRTRAALLNAFRDLILERSYARTRVGDIVRRADVGRSTFYEHFRNKDEILRESMLAVLTVLADAVRVDGDSKRLQFILDHFRENKRLAQGLLKGPCAAPLTRLLAELIESRMSAWCRDTRVKLTVPTRLAATQIAAGQLGLIGAWLIDDEAPSAAVAAALRQSALASVQAMISG